MSSTDAFTADDGSVLVGRFDGNAVWAEKVKDMDAVDVTDEPNCATCFKDLQDNNLIAVSNCGHCQCIKCSDEWEEQTDGGGENGDGAPCPLCRSEGGPRVIAVARKFARGAGSTEDPIKVD